jgi:hypothetical protein
MPATAAVTSRTTVPDRRPARRKHAPARRRRPQLRRASRPRPVKIRTQPGALGSCGLPVPESPISSTSRLRPEASSRAGAILTASPCTRPFRIRRLLRCARYTGPGSTADDAMRRSLGWNEIRPSNAGTRCSMAVGRGGRRPPARTPSTYSRIGHDMAGQDPQYPIRNHRHLESKINESSTRRLRQSEPRSTTSIDVIEDG